MLRPPSSLVVPPSAGGTSRFPDAFDRAGSSVVAVRVADDEFDVTFSAQRRPEREPLHARGTGQSVQPFGDDQPGDGLFGGVGEVSAIRGFPANLLSPSRLAPGRSAARCGPVPDAVAARPRPRRPQTTPSVPPSGRRRGVPAGTADAVACSATTRVTAAVPNGRLVTRGELSAARFGCGRRSSSARTTSVSRISALMVMASPSSRMRVARKHTWSDLHPRGFVIGGNLAESSQGPGHEIFGVAELPRCVKRLDLLDEIIRVPLTTVASSGDPDRDPLPSPPCLQVFLMRGRVPRGSDPVHNDRRSRPDTRRFSVRRRDTPARRSRHTRRDPRTARP